MEHVNFGCRKASVVVGEDADGVHSDVTRITQCRVVCDKVGPLTAEV